MVDTTILTQDEVERALKDYNDGADLAACHIPALCQTVRALRADVEELAQRLIESADKRGEVIMQLTAVTQERDALREQQGKTNDS